MTSAIADVISVPSTSAQAPNVQPRCAVVHAAPCLQLGDVPVVADEEVEEADVAERRRRTAPISRMKKYADQDQHARGQRAQPPLQDPVGEAVQRRPLEDRAAAAEPM